MNETAIPELTVSTSEPAFVTNHRNRIVSINRGAADLLGIEGKEAVGLPCWRVLGGTDMQGNKICRPNCPLLRAARRGKSVARFDANLHTAGKLTIGVSISSVTLYHSAAPQMLSILHLLSPGCWAADTAGCDAKPNVSCAARTHCLITCREIEILRKLADGVRTDEIARQLFISPWTVRTHIEHILAKLGAHSKLEACALARRSGLI